MGPNQTYELSHSKGIYKQNEKTTFRKWEKIFTNDITKKGLISKIYKQLIQLYNKKQTAQLKNVQKS